MISYNHLYTPCLQIIIKHNQDLNLKKKNCFLIFRMLHNYYVYRYLKC